MYQVLKSSFSLIIYEAFTVNNFLHIMNKVHFTAAYQNVRGYKSYFSFLFLNAFE